MIRRLPPARSLFVVLAMLCIGVAGYSASHISDIDRPVALGIIGAAAVLAIWTLAAAWKSRRHRLSESRLTAAFAAVTVAALVGVTAVAFSGIGPFSSEDVSVEPGNTTQVPIQEPTPAPTPTPSPPPDYLLTRQDRNLRASLDAVCLTPEETIRVEMTVRNVGNSTLTQAGFRHLPQDEAVESPLGNQTHPYYAGIPPQRESVFRYSDSTHLDLRPYDLTRETYLVLRFEDAAGVEYGVTFALPPANRIPECE